MDEKNFNYFEDVLKIFYICYGKLYDSVKESVKEAITKGLLKRTEIRIPRWDYYEFESKI